jgi:maleate isomerase
MCTNMRGARLAARVEAELGIPLIDSTSAVVWKALKLMGADGSCIHGWGRLFSL